MPHCYVENMPHFLDVCSSQPVALAGEREHKVSFLPASVMGSTTSDKQIIL